MVGLLGVCELVPLLVMAFVGGALADYLDRRLLVRGGEFALAALCGVLLVNSLSDEPHLWLLYVVAALTAAVDGLQRPALEAMMPAAGDARGAPGHHGAAARWACRSPSSAARRWPAC